MRGNIIMWSGDKGVITASGQRYDFGINEWQGATAPAANMTVEIVVTDGKLTGVTPVNEADIAKEKMAAMTGQGGKIAKAVFENVGKDVAIAYGVFLVAAFFLNVISSAGMLGIELKMTNLLSSNMGITGTGQGGFLILLATATIAVPYFWKHKYAPLAFVVPLLISIKGFWPMYQQYRESQKAMEAMGEFGQMMGQMQEQMTGNSGGLFDNLGFGTYIIVAAAIFLAFKGVVRFLGRS
jgi:membrane protein implicated in regulation of membrane protease activity